MASSGFIQNPFDPRDVYEDEVLSGEVARLPLKFKTEGLAFEAQGSWPFCVSFCVTKMMEEALKRKSGGVVWSLSQPQLFFHSGGSRTGSFFRANLETARTSGSVTYATLPMPLDIWDDSGFDQFRNVALDIPSDADKKITGYVRVNADRDSIKKAIMNYGMVMVGAVASGGYWKDRAVRPAGRDDDHATLLVGWDVDDAWFAFDSLQPNRDFNGYHTFHKDYEFRSVYAVTEIPSDWREMRDAARTPPPGNAQRYGKPRNFQLEADNGYRILNALKHFLPGRMVDRAGRYWSTLINGATYGDYTIQVPHKLIPFRAVPGDIVRDVETEFLTGKHLFNFDLMRGDQK